MPTLPVFRWMAKRRKESRAICCKISSYILRTMKYAASRGKWWKKCVVDITCCHRSMYACMLLSQMTTFFIKDNIYILIYVSEWRVWAGSNRSCSKKASGNLISRIVASESEHWNSPTTTTVKVLNFLVNWFIFMEET